jgi:hypothetical protein
LSWGAGWSAGALVVLGRVDDQLAEELSGGGVDDPDVEVLDQQQDVGSGVVRPMPMWWTRPLTRRVTQPEASMTSWRTRLWLSLLRSADGVALGRAA